MSIFQFGFITLYLSEPLVNSFLAGCAVHVLTSQIKFIFGLHHLTTYIGAFKIPKVFLKSFFYNAEYINFFVDRLLLIFLKNYQKLT